MSVLDVGDVYSAYFYVRDATQTLVDAGAVSATITLPDQTTAAGVTCVRTTVGTYLVTYPTAVTQTGRMVVYVQATGANACAMSDQVDVRTYRAILSMADARATLNFPATYTTDDEELRDYLDAATQLIERRVGPVAAKTYTEDVDFCGDGFVVSHGPVTAVSSIVPVYSYGVAYTAADFQALSTGKIVRKDGAWLSPATYTVTYTAGRTADPDLLHGCRELLRHLWRTQRGSGTRPGQGDDDQWIANYTMPQRIGEILIPLKPAGFA